MVICFSGTGNSRQVADILQDTLGDELVRFPPGLMRDPERISLRVNDPRVIWIMPIHSWGVPALVEHILRVGKIYSSHTLTHYLVCTCGDDIGYADRQWRKLIEDRGWTAGSAFSIQMPNSYTAMKGFDVDTPEVTAGKLAKVPARVAEIAKSISLGETDRVEVVRGSFPWFKTYVIRPWFNKYKTQTKPFHAKEGCVGCGKCANNCPIGVITMVDGHPRWAPCNCIMCLRCYHCCPQHAVAYGKATDGKGQYLCPTYKLK